MSNLTKSVTAFDGRVVFHIRPYVSRRAQVLMTQLIVDTVGEGGLQIEDDVITNPEWTRDHNRFCNTALTTDDITFNLTDDDPTELQALRYFWQNRNGNPVHNFELFIDTLSNGIIDVWHDAYNSTQEPDLFAPPELRKIEDEAGLSDEGQKKGKPSSTPKRKK